MLPWLVGPTLATPLQVAAQEMLLITNQHFPIGCDAPLPLPTWLAISEMLLYTSPQTRGHLYQVWHQHHDTAWEWERVGLSGPEGVRVELFLGHCSTSWTRECTEWEKGREGELKGAIYMYSRVFGCQYMHAYMFVHLHMHQVCIHTQVCTVYLFPI